MNESYLEFIRSKVGDIDRDGELFGCIFDVSDSAGECLSVAKIVSVPIVGEYLQ
jgi:hypothetical protein